MWVVFAVAVCVVAWWGCFRVPVGGAGIIFTSVLEAVQQFCNLGPGRGTWDLGPGEVPVGVKLRKRKVFF